MIKQRRIIGVFALAGVFAAPAIGYGASLEDIEKQIKAAFEKLKTYSVNIASVTDIKQGGQNISMNMTGKYEAMNTEDGKNKYRLEGKSTTKMEGMENMPGMGEQEILIVCDGEYTYQMQSMMGMKNAVKSKADADAIPWSKQRDEYEFTVLPEEQVDGQDCFVVEGKAKTAGGMGLSRVVFYVRKDLGAMVKQVAYDAEGNTINTVNFTDAQANPDLSPDRFKWETPEGVTVVDRTGEDDAVEKPTDKPAEKPADEPGEKPADEPEDE